MNKKTLTSFLFFTFIAITSNAQNNMGVATGSYSRINSMYLNPANIASSTEKITVNLIGFNVGVDNNLGTFTKISDLGQALSSKDSNSQSVFTNSGRKDFSMMVPEVNIHGPVIIFSINRKNSIAITTGIRVINQFNNFDQQLYNTVILKLDCVLVLTLPHPMSLLKQQRLLTGKAISLNYTKN